MSYVTDRKWRSGVFSEVVGIWQEAMDGYGFYLSSFI